MKVNFEIKQLNSPFADPVFFVRNVYKKRAFLFDLGRLGGIENSEILDISDVFVTHTHMDHFSGFDRFLRGVIASSNHIRFFGPANFIKNVQGRIDSYTWNLITDYDVELTAIELNGSNSKKASFKAKNSFQKIEEEFTLDELNLGDGFKLEYEIFDHGTACIGYRVKEPVIFSIRKDALKVNGFIEGAWLKEFKNRLQDDTACKIVADTKDGKKEFDILELKATLVDKKAPQDITYITDIAPTTDNIEKAVKFAADSYLLIIEAVFMDTDKHHSLDKNHLTIGIAKELLERSKSQYVRFIHFAPRYDQLRTEFFAELYSGVKNKIFQI